MWFRKKGHFWFMHPSNTYLDFIRFVKIIVQMHVLKIKTTLKLYLNIIILFSECTELPPHYHQTDGKCMIYESNYPGEVINA